MKRNFISFDSHWGDQTLKDWYVVFFQLWYDKYEKDFRITILNFDIIFGGK